MKVAIIYYSTYGHILSLAEEIKAGVEKSGKATAVDIFQVPETLSPEVLEKLHAAPKANYPIATNDTLTEYDAFVFGYPTRFGTLPAQFVDFLGATGGLWATGALHGKPVSLFTSVSSPGGAQETPFRNFFSYIAHHGLIYVPLGYAKAFAEITNMDEVHGGTPYGAVTFAGTDGSRQPSDLEKKIANIQGETFAETAVKFVNTPSTSSSETALASEKETKETGKSGDKVVEGVKPAAERTAQKATATAEKAEESGCGIKCVIV